MNKHTLDQQTIDNLLKNALKVGDSVRINDDICLWFEPNKEFNLGGFQGRIFDVWILYDEVVYDIAYDSITLNNLTPDFVKYCIEFKNDFACYSLYAKEVTPAKPRDTEKKTVAVRKALGIKHHCLSILDEIGYVRWSKETAGNRELRIVPSDHFAVVHRWCNVRRNIEHTEYEHDINKYFEVSINNYRKRKNKPPISFTREQKKMPWE